MIPELAGAINAIRGASDIINGLLAFKMDTKMSAKVMDLNRMILDVQQQVMAANESYSDAQSRIKELETEIAKLNNWAQEKQRYALHPLVPGTFVYRIKPEAQGSEPAHDLCPNCYHEGFKSILQYYPQYSRHGTAHVFRCPKCQTEYRGAQIPSSTPQIEAIPTKHHWS